MTTTFYEPLSHLDASFLALETPTTHMHVAGVVLFDGKALRTAEGGIDIERIRQHIAGKLAYIPRYRQRLAWTPGNRHPVWVDDDYFNFDYHVRHSSLPRPGTDEQLKRLAGRIVSQPLDRAKPLWELWVVEGLSENRFAIIAKIHHSMVDGVSGVDLTTILLNVVPTADVEPEAEWRARRVPSASQLAVAEAARNTRTAIDTLTNLRTLSTRGREVAVNVGGRGLAALSSLKSGWLQPATRTPLNPDLGPNRRFDWTTTSLADIKEIRRTLGGSVNDVVLAIAAGAIRRFLTKHRGFDLEGVEFRAMNPVSTRRVDQRGSLGNQVAMWLVTLPVEDASPVSRLEKIKAETSRLKSTKQALGAATLVELSRGTPLTIISLANRVVGPLMRPFNLTVTNVPGPQFPMYLLEAPMLANYPIVPLWAQHGLGFALFSYNGSVAWGVHADFDAFPDLETVTASIDHANKELLRAARARAGTTKAG